jgi:hypothetical protein
VIGQGAPRVSEQPRPAGTATVGGLSFSHDPVDTPPVFAGPATAAEENTVRFPLIPVACWKVGDIRFDFASSLPVPNISVELVHLGDLLAAHPKSPLSVFGHADPVGDDDFNKKLSGRRAAAVYGMLVRSTDIWEDIFSNTGIFTSALPADRWGLHAVQVMLATLGFRPGNVDGDDTPETQSALRQFQSQNGLPASGRADKPTRKKLYAAYMDKLCGSLKLDKSQFLAQGADPQGKGDFQGCSEFNPVLIFSDKDNRRFEGAKDTSERNEQNAPNRRVMVLLFRPGSRVVPARWPCPRAKEGVAGCRARFWSDGESRRSRRKPDDPRTFDDSKDTFACRFYHRLVVNSPCERALQVIRVHWIADTPSVPAGFELSLAVTDKDDREVQRIPASTASGGPGEFRTFDLRGLDPVSELRLAVAAAGGRQDRAVRDTAAGKSELLDERLKLFLGKASLGLLAEDREIAASAVEPVLAQVTPADPPSSPDISTTGFEYRELITSRFR